MTVDIKNNGDIEVSYSSFPPNKEEVEAFYQLNVKEQAEKEALETAKMYFGEYN